MRPAPLTPVTVTCSICDTPNTWPAFFYTPGRSHGRDEKETKNRVLIFTNWSNKTIANRRGRSFFFCACFFLLIF